jgi:hypothetical protein
MFKDKTVRNVKKMQKVKLRSPQIATIRMQKVPSPGKKGRKTL